MKRVFKFILGLFKYLVLIGIIGVLLLFLFLYPTLSKDYSEAKKTVALSSAETFYPDMASKILDKDGKVILTVTKEHKTFSYLSSDEIPENVKHAFVAIEDRTFYDNPGYDLKGMARVVLRYVLSKGTEAHGASTITQQLCKLTFLSSEQTLSRKVKELFYARELTKKYSKDKILEYYINNCCFANSIYGIEAASEQYLHKSVKDLNLAETAYLCAIPNSPEYYDPWKDSAKVIPRQKKILSDMETCGYITESQYREAVQTKVTVFPQESVPSDNPTVLTGEQTYAVQCAVEELMRENGFQFQTGFSSDDAKKEYENAYSEAYKNAKDLLYTHRYTVTTSLDPAISAMAQAALDSETAIYGTETSENGVYAFEAASAVFDNTTGKIVAVIGGRTQDGITDKDSLNRAFQMYRQPGSTMKPLFVYAPALDHGFRRSSVLTNVNVDKAKSSNNVLAMGGSKVDLYTALTRSMNGPAYWLSAKIGPDTGMNCLTKMRFDGLVPEDNTLSTALGGLTYGTNPVEMAAAYGTFTDQGYYRTPTCVTRVLDMNGTNVYEEPEEVKVYSEAAADEMADIMKGVLTEGTAKRVGWDNPSIDAAGKTGTTNDTKDVWFTGYTPYYTVSVWMGRDDAKSMEGRIQSTAPAKLWKLIMEQLIQGKEEAHFETQTSVDAKVSLSVPYETAEIPYYFPSEKIQSGYTVADYRRECQTRDAIVKQAKAFKGSASEKNDLLCDLTAEALDIENPNIQKDALSQVYSVLGYSTDSLDDTSMIENLKTAEDAKNQTDEDTEGETK